MKNFNYQKSVKILKLHSIRKVINNDDNNTYEIYQPTSQPANQPSNLERLNYDLNNNHYDNNHKDNDKNNNNKIMLLMTVVKKY